MRPLPQIIGTDQPLLLGDAILPAKQRTCTASITRHRER